MYHAFGNEVNILNILNSDKVFSLPVIQSNNTMIFKQISVHSQLVKNKYGIPEPVDGTSISATAIDLCLIPLVGFNRHGDRLGMGSGYYDKYFALNKFNKKPTILAGIAYDFQENDTIPSDQWDIPLDIIFTNKEVIIP
jgi:5-formyltetrahydrofolate cyclo-ligase